MLEPSRSMDKKGKMGRVLGRREAAVVTMFMGLWSADPGGGVFLDMGFKKGNLESRLQHSPFLQDRGNTFCSIMQRCKKCHIPISVTPVKYALSSRTPGRWRLWSRHYQGFFSSSMSLHKNSGLASCWKARQDLGPWRLPVAVTTDRNFRGLSVASSGHSIPYGHSN